MLECGCVYTSAHMYAAVYEYADVCTYMCDCNIHVCVYVYELYWLCVINTRKCTTQMNSNTLFMCQIDHSSFCFVIDKYLYIRQSHYILYIVYTIYSICIYSVNGPIQSHPFNSYKYSMNIVIVHYTVYSIQYTVDL